MVNSYGSKTKSIALNGIMAALVAMSLFLASVMPTNRISLYALSSFFAAVIVVEYGIRAGWAFYAATSLLAFIILPDKFSAVLYLAFFGFYGIVKYYIEKLKNMFGEYLLKLVYFNAFLIALYFFARDFLFLNVTGIIPIWVFIVLSEVVFIIYDYVYGLFIQYYRSKLRKLIGIK